jgi:hypothetical protein
MATIGITKELRDRVGSVIRNMERREIKSDVPDYEQSYSVDTTYLYHYGCWGKEHMHLVHDIPHDWLGKVTEARISLKGVLDDGRILSTNVNFTGLNAFQRPSDSYYSKGSSTLNLEELRAMPEVVAGRAELLKRWDEAVQVHYINERWAKILNDIDEFLDKCKTLNEAVKLFPGVRLYIHADDLERLDRKVERASQRRKIVEELAVDELTAAAIASKLMGAV